MLETANIADVTSYFKALPPDWQPPPPNQGPNDAQLLAMVEQQKTSATIETNRGKAQTDRATLLMQDDRERDKAALDAWVQAWKTAAQFGTPAPSLTEFQQAMRNDTPRLGLIGDVPPASSPQQPPTSPQAQQQPKGPPGPMNPQGGLGQGGPMRPPGGPGPSMMPPTGSTDPSTAQAVRRALAGQGMPTAYGMIAERAMASPVAGMGGPSLPKPTNVTGAG
jgi:hypothetical protein